ncbi:putative addiction module antidote protein [Oxalobacter aliiformigenes]|uniref:addiction module antidote protein n=1 Tax=Oxalobacter aliiformigenes TaxID=2946593 RepID=UPI0022AF1427|nr:addiction module antidote protein [Oxalobacter aliiformigenes]MCZ4065481.1 putative addiction module antidote protein [Oxalobacter aliiformigenes]WAV99643.1 putative addiction module antidote protein [Oxalobacter aliiformigenes]
MTIKTTRFDVADFLDSEEAIQEYFRQVVEDGDPDEIVRALGHIARARGMTQLAKDTGLGRESLYKALSEGSKPRFDTIMRVTKALGLTLTVAQA